MKSWRIVVAVALLHIARTSPASIITTDEETLSCNQFVNIPLEIQSTSSNWSGDALRVEAWRVLFASCAAAGEDGTNSQQHEDIFVGSFAAVPLALNGAATCESATRLPVEYLSSGQWRSGVIQASVAQVVPTLCDAPNPVSQSSISLLSGETLACSASTRVRLASIVDGAWDQFQVELTASDLFPLLCGDELDMPDCLDSTDNDGDGRIDLSDRGCTSRWDADEQTAVGAGIEFSRVDPPDSGQGGQSGWFGVYVWRNGGEGYAALSDHGEHGGNDPIWRWHQSGWVYEGQLSAPNQIRHGFVTNATENPGSLDQHPVTGGQGYSSGRNDLIHNDGIEGGEAICADEKYWNGACQAFGDVNGDGIDDILRSDGTVWDGRSVSPSSETAYGTQIGSGIPMFRSHVYTKAACMGDFGQGKVLTDEGLFDLQGNRVAVLPRQSQIKGGMACGDFDNDGDIDVMFSEGGDDYGYGGTTRLLRNVNNTAFESMPLGGLPATGGLERRYNISYAVDFNGDGCDDLLLADHGMVYESDCEFGWTARQEFYNRGRKAVAHFGDFNGDGRVDFCASLDQSTGHPQCFLNVTDF